MNSLTREEFEAGLEALEARQDARVSIIATRLDALTQLVTDRFAHVGERMSRLEITVDAPHAYLRNLKSTIFATALASVLGIAALNATVMSNMLSAFQAGKDNATVQTEFRRQARDIDAAMAELGRRSKAVDGALVRIGQQSNKVNETLAEMRQTWRQMAATQAALQRQAGQPKRPRQ